MKSAGVITILTVDDHPIIRDAIAGAVKDEADMSIVGEAQNGADAIEAFRRHRPDITLLDLRMPLMNGTEALKTILGEFPSARIIILTTYEGDVHAARALRAGAQGYLLKSMLRRDLLETIRTVHAGKRCIPAEVAERMAEYFDQNALSDREAEVLRLVAEGLSNKIAAHRLSVSEDTVKSHMKSILAKLGANDRTHAVTIALKRGFLDS